MSSLLGKKRKRDELSDILECPICMDVMRYELIYQCKEGHVICGSCKYLLDKPDVCPSCKCVLGNIRSRALEKVRDRTDLPCSFSEFGCTVTRQVMELRAHENQCTFKPIDCPIKNCNWKVAAHDLRNHFVQKHPTKVKPIDFDLKQPVVRSHSGDNTVLLISEDETNLESFLLSLRVRDKYSGGYIKLQSLTVIEKYSHTISISAGDMEIQWSGQVPHITDNRILGMSLPIKKDLWDFMLTVEKSVDARKSIRRSRTKIRCECEIVKKERR